MEKTEEKRVWGIHTMNDRLFLNSNVIAIGWREMGDLSLLPNTREAFKEHYMKTYEGVKKQSAANGAGMLYRFTHEVQIGDYVVFPSKFNREINLGIIESDYIYNPSEHDYVQQHKVKWMKHFPRTAFSQGALYEVGSALSFFSIKNYADEYLSAFENDFQGKVVVAEDEEAAARSAEEIIEITKDYILKELSRQFKGFSLEHFTADLFRAMGYRADVSPQGGDSGIDIIAYKDELPPRILVQVKSQDGDVKETTIQSLKGAMREGDYGVFITLSHYTQRAQSYLRATPIIRGINGEEFVELVLRYYDKLSEKHRKMIPLKMVYVPVSD